MDVGANAKIIQWPKMRNKTIKRILYYNAKYEINICKSILI